MRQARYDNWLVNVVTIGSAVALLVRIVLGYQRMADRWVWVSERRSAGEPETVLPTGGGEARAGGFTAPAHDGQVAATAERSSNT